MVGFPETCRPKRDQGAIADDVLTVLAVDHRQVGALIVFRAKPWRVLRGDAQPAKWSLDGGRPAETGGTCPYR